MNQPYDLVIRNARLRQQPGTLHDIAVQAGRIERIENSIPESAALVIDAKGQLVTESFVNPHLHLDKVYTLQRLDERAMRSIRPAWTAMSWRVPGC